jgi:hypothetical protein
MANNPNWSDQFGLYPRYFPKLNQGVFMSSLVVILRKTGCFFNRVSDNIFETTQRHKGIEGSSKTKFKSEYRISNIETNSKS